jgi:hypothetical protein
MAIFRNDIVGPIWVPPIPSARPPRDTTRWAIRGWPVHYLNAHLLEEWWAIVQPLQLSS